MFVSPTSYLSNSIMGSHSVMVHNSIIDQIKRKKSQNNLNWYNFRAEQRVYSNLIGQVVLYITLYKPLQVVYITFSRHGY